MVELKAKKTFYNAGRFTIAGDTFKVKEHQVVQYTSRDLAEAVGGPVHTEPATAGEKVFEDQTVAELRNVAKSLNITGYYNMTKGEIVEAIRAAETQAATEGAL